MQPSGSLFAGKYEIGDRLGRGDSSAVYAALLVSHNLPVALKILDAQVAGNPEATARFFHGARVMAGLGAGTVRVLDVGTAENGAPYVVMDLLDAESLRARVQRRRALPLAELAPLVHDVAVALDALHARGLLHQDIKPDDILVIRTEGREVGLLTGMSLAGPPIDGTRGGGVLGTPYFLAPERLQAGFGTDARSDLWSLGVVVYFAATGVLPFEAPSMPELFAAILEAPLPVPSRVAPHVPPGFDAWFARACARDRRERFSSAAELADALAASMHHPTAGFGTPSHEPPSFTPCASCGEPVRVPPMVFCPNCGVRLVDPGTPTSIPLPTNTAPVGPPSFVEFGGLGASAAPELGQYHDPEIEPLDPMPNSQPTLALQTDAYGMAAGRQGPQMPSPVGPPPPSQPTVAAAEEPYAAFAAAPPPETPVPPAPPPPPSQPTLALSNVDSYAPSPIPPRPPSQPTLAVEVPEIPANAVRPPPLPRLDPAPTPVTAPAPFPAPTPLSITAPVYTPAYVPPPPVPVPAPVPVPVPAPAYTPPPAPTGPPMAAPAPVVHPPPAAESAPMLREAPSDPYAAGGPSSSDKPSAWLFRARLGVWRRGEVLAAGFAATGVNALAVTASRVVATRGGGWEDVQLDAKIDLTRVKAIRGVGSDAFFLLGAGGLVMRVTLEGSCAFWGLDLDPSAPIAASEITFYDALPEGDGALFVGERPGATGTVGILARGAPRSVKVVVPGTPAARLRSIARIAGGAVVACGAGKLVAFEKDAVAGVVEIAPGELNHIVPNEGGALVVGAGAYAFAVGPKLHAQLEEVQTTSDLVSLCAYEGTGWAGSARGARILRRNGAGLWTRLTGNLGTDAGVIALAATEREVRAVLDDGTLVTGTLGM